MKIKKGDQVQIKAGKDRGKTGTVLKVLKDANRILVEGVNVYKKRMKPRRQNQQGETVSVPRTLHISNAMFVCKNCKKPSRVAYRFEGDKKIRICRKCQAAA